MSKCKNIQIGRAWPNLTRFVLLYVVRKISLQRVPLTKVTMYRNIVAGLFMWGSSFFQIFFFLYISFNASPMLLCQSILFFCISPFLFKHMLLSNIYNRIEHNCTTYMKISVFLVIYVSYFNLWLVLHVRRISQTNLES